MNEENINKLFEELATKANSEDAVNKAEVETLRNEIADLRDQMARKSQTKSHTADTSAQDDERAAKMIFVKGRHAIEDGDVKATEFSRLVGAEGGNTVPTVFDGEITRGLGKVSPIRNLSRVVSVKANLERIIKMRVGGAAKTKAEKAAYTLNTTDQFGKLIWGTTEIVDQQRHTSWVSDDQESILNLAQELQDSMILTSQRRKATCSSTAPRRTPFRTFLA